MQSELTFDESTIFLRFREVFWGFSFVFRRGGRQAGAADARAGAGAGGGGCSVYRSRRRTQVPRTADSRASLLSLHSTQLWHGANSSDGFMSCRQNPVKLLNSRE